MTPRTALIVALVLWTIATIPLPVDAVTTGAATAITSNSTVLHGTGCASDACWFEYGPVSGTEYMWRTDNLTPVAGAFESEIHGLPLLTNTKYYYRAFDAAGTKGSESSFTTLVVATITPEPTFGEHTANITRQGWSIPVMAAEVLGPYTDVSPPAYFFAVVFFFMYAGIWISSRNTIMATVIGLSTSFALFYSGANSIGIAADFTWIAEGLLIASIASIVFVLIKR